jgi:hypothetical protein
MEFRVTVRIVGHGSEEDAERLLEGFLATHPEAGPVVDADVSADVLAVTYSVDADDPAGMVDSASRIFAGGYARSGLPVADLSAEVEVVDAAAELQRELQLA